MWISNFLSLAILYMIPVCDVDTQTGVFPYRAVNYQLAEAILPDISADLILEGSRLPPLA
jgi:hypothetical protein